MYGLFVLAFPSFLMTWVILSLKTPTRKKLLAFGALLIFCCLTVAPLLLSLLDRVGGYESQLETCKINFIYELLSNPQVELASLDKCDEIPSGNIDDLKSFKTLLVILTLLINVILVSLGVNLLAAASSMSDCRLSQENVYENIDGIKTNVSRIDQNLKSLWTVVGVLILCFLSMVFLIGANT